MKEFLKNFETFEESKKKYDSLFLVFLNTDNKLYCLRHTDGIT